MYGGPLASAMDAATCNLVYMSGADSFSLDQQELAALGAFVQRGGVLMGESSMEGRPGERGSGFEIGFKVIAERIGCKLAPVTRGHPVFDARHPFAVPPEGAAGNSELLEGGGAVYSSADYGCAWAGGYDSRLLSRQGIRDALELGVNIATYAVQRRRRVELQSPSL